MRASGSDGCPRHCRLAWQHVEDAHFGWFADDAEVANARKQRGVGSALGSNRSGKFCSMFAAGSNDVDRASMHSRYSGDLCSGRNIVRVSGYGKQKR